MTYASHMLYSRGTKVAYRAKHTFFAPEMYTAGILYTDSLNSRISSKNLKVLIRSILIIGDLFYERITYIK